MTSVCLGLVCKQFWEIHKSSKNKRRISSSERAVRSLLEDEKLDVLFSIIWIGPPLRDLIALQSISTANTNTASPNRLKKDKKIKADNDIKFCIWRNDVLLLREGATNFFSVAFEKNAGALPDGAPRPFWNGLTGSGLKLSMMEPYFRLASRAIHGQFNSDSGIFEYFMEDSKTAFWRDKVVEPRYLEPVRGQSIGGWTVHTDGSPIW